MASHAYNNKMINGVSNLIRYNDLHYIDRYTIPAAAGALSCSIPAAAGAPSSSKNTYLYIHIYNRDPLSDIDILT
jgi:type IV secretory pathway VirB6-like protein